MRTINGGVGFLKEIIVKEGARQKGAGMELMKFFEDFCREKGCHKLTIKTSEKHTVPLKLYKKAGFEIESELKDDKFHVTWLNLYKFIK